jgi:hypothetical protein
VASYPYCVLERRTGAEWRVEVSYFARKHGLTSQESCRVEQRESKPTCREEESSRKLSGGRGTSKKAVQNERGQSAGYRGPDSSERLCNCVLHGLRNWPSLELREVLEMPANNLSLVFVCPKSV